MGDAYSEEAQFNLPAGTGNNPQEDYDENFEMADMGSHWVTCEIEVGHGGVAGEVYTFNNSGNAIKAIANDPEKCRIVFILTEDTVEGVEGKFLKGGWLEITGWSLDITKNYWLSSTVAGALEAARPALGSAVRMGRPKTADRFHIQVSIDEEIYKMVSAVVGADGADYATISAACTGEAGGASIFVKVGTIEEVADIIPKEGQTIVAFGSGIEGADFSGVRVNMNGYRIDINVTEVTIQGIWFNLEVDANETYVDCQAHYAVIRDCTFHFTDGGAQVHSGVLIVSDYADIQNIRIEAGTYTYYPLLVSNCNYGLARNIRITGGTMFVDPVPSSIMYVSGCTEWNFEDIRISSITDEHADAYALEDIGIGGLNGNHYRDIFITIGSVAQGATVEGNSDIHKCSFDNIVITGAAGKFLVDDVIGVRISNSELLELEINGEDTQVSHCTMDTLDITADGVHTVLSNVIATTFTDVGQDTVRDEWTMRNVVAAFNVMGSSWYDNAGAGGAVIGTLPDPAAKQVSKGYKCRFSVITDEYLTIQLPALCQIYFDSQATIAAGTLQSDEVGSTIELTYMGSNIFLAHDPLGAWEVD